MRNTITLFFLLIATSAFCQMKVTDGEPGEEIGTFKTLGTTYAELTRYDDQVVFTYHDEKFKRIDEYKEFTFNYDDLETLYDLFTNFDGIKKGDVKTVDLESGDMLSFKYKKTFGQMYAEVTHHSKAGNAGRIRWMKKKQVKKLFGKK